MTGPKDADFGMRFPALLFAVFALAGCSSQPRFVHIGGSTFVMFDNQTAQSCYAGSPKALEDRIQSMRKQADAHAYAMVVTRPPRSWPDALHKRYVELTEQIAECSEKTDEEYREVERLTEIQKLPTCRSLLTDDHRP